MKQLYATEYADGLEGTSSASKKQFQLTNAEERKRLAHTEWWKRGTEHKWDEMAVQYRGTIERILVLLAR